MIKERWKAKIKVMMVNDQGYGRLKSRYLLSPKHVQTPKIVESMFVDDHMSTICVTLIFAQFHYYVKTTVHSI